MNALNPYGVQQSGGPSSFSKPTNDSDDHPYKIKKIPIDDPEFISETPKGLRNENIPGFPSTVLILGPPGSGKSNVLFNLLLHHWKGFFDKVYFFGPTCKSDKIYKNISVSDDHICVDEDEFIPKLQSLVREQINEVKHDPKGAPKCLFVFEDITSYYDQVQRTPAFSRCFTAIRHHKATALANVHKYKAMNRTARICAKHLIIFPIVDTDLKQVAEDFGISGMDIKQFCALAKFAWKKTPDNPKPFFYINTYADEEERFRKCFTEIITVADLDQTDERDPERTIDSQRGKKGRKRKRRGDRGYDRNTELKEESKRYKSIKSSETARPGGDKGKPEEPTPQPGGGKPVPRPHTGRFVEHEGKKKLSVPFAFI